MTTQKLELTWVGKNHKIRLEPRILIEDTEKSYGDPDTGNMLIHWDNLLALKALEQDYAGKVKCIYIDPPYNTGNAFEHYDDGLEHSEWLNLMKPRLEILRRLLSEKGSIWISIDSYESHYLKVLCDEIFGRQNFIDEVIWQRAYSPINLKKTLSKSHDSILVYSKNSEWFELNKLPRSDEANDRYKNPDNDIRWKWKSSDLSVGPAIEKNIYEITTPSWRVVLPPKGYSWRLSEDRLAEFIKDNRIWFWPNWDATPSIKRFISEVKDGITPMTLWTYQEVWHNQDAKREIKALFWDDIFWTPKPEALMERVIMLASNEWDLILDSFLGSWTTCAVAHKMWRKWIGIELWNHAYTHCKVRLDKVIDWTDNGWITESTEWKWWGWYKFYELWPSVMAKDERGRYVINPNMNGELLVRALCKIENFRYLPKGDGDIIKHGYSSERDFLHVTTRLIDQEAIDRIQSKYLKDDESILILAKTVADGLRLPPNIQVKKIPNEILRKCEYAKDDYSLPILTQTQEELEGLKKDIIQIDNQD